MSVTHSVVVADPIGLHARPVGQIVTVVKESGLTVTIQRPGGDPVSASSALRMLAMKVKTGESLDIVVESENSEEGLALAHNIEALINQG
jgi:phosphocarrier protein HPr